MGAQPEVTDAKSSLLLTGVLSFHPDNRFPLNADLLSAVLIGVEQGHPWRTHGATHGIIINQVLAGAQHFGVPGGMTLEFVEGAHGGHLQQGALHAFSNFVRTLAREVAALDIPGVSSVTSYVKSEAKVGLHYSPTAIRQLEQQFPGQDHTSGNP